MTFNAGDQVTLNPDTRANSVSGDRVGGAYHHRTITFRPGMTGTVSRSGTGSSLVRVDNEGSIWIANEWLQLAGVSITGRRRGTPPEGMIAPDDPRLEWMWDDISEYAQDSQYCDVFDKVLRELHLPPRKRKFHAVGDLNGLNITAQIMAKNQREANEELARRLSAALSTAEAVEA